MSASNHRRAGETRVFGRWAARVVLATSLALLGLIFVSGPAESEQAGAGASERAATPSAAELEAGRQAFGEVARVLLSPRCRNCHPAGDAPLHGDAGVPHSMNISRRSVAAGLRCTACHRDSNSPLPGAPPGAPNWHLPPAETPMVFEGLSPASLCVQLKDPAENGGRGLDDLVDHVDHDPFVLWGWEPGPGRSKPPIAHAAFVAAMRTWAEAGGPCPDAPE
ncbi:hypothetical protein [Haliangium ochraceum]|uniref:Isoquinoline 1-oxidoreductase subunit n=1 Tax=Haliangium ochraceum (strain DSM 14365 / JCM 11303 / SMP-2) TaxID=502025 RepID=D0LG86_HALO1|nr:hypothetical protein [Haliangium ochraceum]ACY18111.1 hypothetical protein Hoch_5634 [Haliangium ochraceum DSM 14365]